MEMTSKLDDFVQGSCMEMCPKAERDLRQRERLLHYLEVAIASDKKDGKKKSYPDADPFKTVKEYSRSAAGLAAPKASDLRPLPVLIKTTNYLIGLAIVDKCKSPDWNTVYDFVADRLRAVRKDLIIQGLHDLNVLPVLEPMVIFHIYSGYRLSECKPAVFDAKLNDDMLTDCLRRVLDIYDSNSDVTSELMDSLFALHFIHGSEGILRLISLYSYKGFIEPSFPSQAMSIIFAHGLGNYAKFFRLFKNLPAPLACAVARHLPTVRRNTWLTMSTAYSSKVLKVPTQYLAELCLLSNVDDAAAELKHYGIACDSAHVNFQRNNFNPEAKLVSHKRLPQLDIEKEMEEFICSFIHKNKVG